MFCEYNSYSILIYDIEYLQKDRYIFFSHNLHHISGTKPRFQNFCILCNSKTDLTSNICIGDHEGPQRKVLFVRSNENADDIYLS